MSYEPLSIDPDAVFDDAAVVLNLGISSTMLAKARRNGELRFTRRGRRTFYLGRWLLDWLTGGTHVAKGVERD